MKLKNEMMAKIMGEIIANGMSLSDVDLKEETELGAVSILEKVLSVFSQNIKDSEKVKLAEKIFIDSGLKEEKKK